MLRLYEYGVLDLASAKPRMLELQMEKERAVAALAKTVAGPMVRLHPGAVEAYRRQVADLHVHLNGSDEEALHRAVAVIRSLVEKLVIRPDGNPGDIYEIEIHGKLAAFLHREGEENHELSVGTMVAGAGFEPAAFRL